MKTEITVDETLYDGCLTREQYYAAQEEEKQLSFVPEEINLKAHSDALNELVQRHLSEYNQLYRSILRDQGINVNLDLMIERYNPTGEV